MVNRPHIPWASFLKKEDGKAPRDGFSLRPGKRKSSAEGSLEPKFKQNGIGLLRIACTREQLFCSRIGRFVLPGPMVFQRFGQPIGLHQGNESVLRSPDRHHAQRYDRIQISNIILQSPFHPGKEPITHGTPRWEIEHIQPSMIPGQSTESHLRGTCRQSIHLQRLGVVLRIFKPFLRHPLLFLSGSDSVFVVQEADRSLLTVCVHQRSAV